MSLPYKGINSEVFTYEEKAITWILMAKDINLNPLSFEREVKLRCALPDKELSPVSSDIKAQIKLRQSQEGAQCLEKMVHDHAACMLQDRSSVKESLKLYADFYREVFKDEARKYIAILVYSVMKPESLFTEDSGQQRKALLKLSGEKICIYAYKHHDANLIGDILYPHNKEMQIDLAYSVAELIRKTYYPDEEAGNSPLSSELTGVASSDAGANVYEGRGIGF